MVQFSDERGLVPRVLQDLPFDAWTWQQVQRVLAGSGATSPGAIGQPEDARFAGGAMLHTASGAPIYVVVVERERAAAEETLPEPPELRREFGLSRREAEVALLLARRLTSQEVAEAVGFTVHTARRHTEKVLAKMGLQVREEVRQALLALARRQDELMARQSRLELAAVEFRGARRARAVA